jgi:hypothetical protein
MNPTNICACIGPLGDCPCLRRSRGQKVEITETSVAPEIFSLLDDEDKTLINRLKVKALGRYLNIKNKNRAPPQISEPLSITQRMDINSPPGTKVIFDANGGYDSEKQWAKTLLEEGKEYTVKQIDVHSYTSSVTLEELSHKFFNSVLFAKRQ